MLRRALDVGETERSFVGEGVVPATAFQLQPWTPGTALTTGAMLVLAALAGWVGMTSEPFSWALIGSGAVIGLLGLLALGSRLFVELRYSRARRAGHDFSQRFEIDDTGVRHFWRKPDGTETRREYEWFVFSQVVVQPHRLVLWLRVPTRSDSTRGEVLLVPAALFGADFAALTALVLEHVSKPSTPVQPADSRAGIKTIALWLVLLAVLAGLYVLLRE